jgi:transposase
MRQVREVLRLGFAGISKHEIARRTGLAPSTVRETLKRFASTGLTWPLPDEVTDGVLEATLYRNAGKKQGHRRQVEPDWAVVHRELKRKHVTLSILWDEYIEQHPDGYRYSRFCDLYRGWEGKLSVTMRQAHAGGEKLFVDYAGDRRPADRRGPGRVDIRRRARRVELHLRRSDLDAGAGRLDRRPCAGAGSDRRRAPADCPG